MSINFTQRTAYSYVTEKIRQNDTYDAVSVGELRGTPALILTQQINGESYSTYLYFYEGYLKELFIRKDSFAGTDILSAGQDIMALSSFTAEEAEKGLIKLTIDTGDGPPMILYTALRSDYS